MPPMSALAVLCVIGGTEAGEETRLHRARWPSEASSRALLTVTKVYRTAKPHSHNRDSDRLVPGP